MMHSVGRNLLNQAHDPPFGYPVFVSEPAGSAPPAPGLEDLILEGASEKVAGWWAKLVASSSAHKSPGAGTSGSPPRAGGEAQTTQSPPPAPSSAAIPAPAASVSAGDQAATPSAGAQVAE
jgi:hypothetical protein